MWKWLRALLGAKPREEEGADDRTLALQGEIQGLRLELGERERAVASLRTELERQRKAEGGRVGEAVESQKERLMRDLGPPAAQVVTQAHLLEVDGRPVQARDVLALAKRLVRVLEDHGMTLEGKVGEAVPYDPNRHQFLGGEAAPAVRQNVMVRFAGVSFKGKMLVKAGVEKLPNPT